MTSPHDRDGRFYGFNEDPYTRDPYRDPYTGYPVEPPPSTSYLNESERVPQAEPRGEVAPQWPWFSRSFRGVGMYLGGLAAVAACALVGAWLLLIAAVGALYRFADRMQYWAKHAISPAPTEPDLESVLGWVLFAVAVAGAVMWLMKLLVPRPSLFFLVLGLLLSVATALFVWQRDEGAVTAPLAVGVLILGVCIVRGVEVCGRYLHAIPEAK